MKADLMRLAARAACRLPRPLIRLLGGPPKVVDGQRMDPLVQFMVRYFADPPGTLDSVARTREGFDVQGTWLTHRPQPGVSVTPWTAEGSAGPIPCEIHRPKGLPARDAPVLVFYHGGGHAAGSLVSHRGVCRQLAHDAQCAVVAVDYRLAPEHRFPTAVDDTWAALQWLRERAAAFGLDATRIAVGGDSAGGTLAAVAAILARDHGQPLTLQLLITPGTGAAADTPSHKLFANGFLLDAASIAWFFDHYAASHQRHDWRFAPLLADDLDGVAPACVILAECDPLVDEGLAYADRLRAAGVPVALELYRGLTHDFIKMGRVLKEAVQAQQAAADALRHAWRTAA